MRRCCNNCAHSRVAFDGKGKVAFGYRQCHGGPPQMQVAMTPQGPQTLPHWPVLSGAKESCRLHETQAEYEGRKRAERALFGLEGEDDLAEVKEPEPVKAPEPVKPPEEGEPKKLLIH